MPRAATRARAAAGVVPDDAVTISRSIWYALQGRDLNVDALTVMPVSEMATSRFVRGSDNERLARLDGDGAVAEVLEDIYWDPVGRGTTGRRRSPGRFREVERPWLTDSQVDYASVCGDLMQLVKVDEPDDNGVRFVHTADLGTYGYSQHSHFVEIGTNSALEIPLLVRFAVSYSDRPNGGLHDDTKLDVEVPRRLLDRAVSWAVDLVGDTVSRDDIVNQMLRGDSSYRGLVSALAVALREETLAGPIRALNFSTWSL